MGSFQTGTQMNPLLKVIPAYCIRVFLSFLFLCSFLSFFLLFCRPVFIFHPRIFVTTFLLYFTRLFCIFIFLFLLCFLCRLSLIPDVFHLSLRYVFFFGRVPAYCLFLPVLHSSLLYFKFSFSPLFLMQVVLISMLISFSLLYGISSSFVVFLHTVFSFLPLLIRLIPQPSTAQEHVSPVATYTYVVASLYVLSVSVGQQAIACTLVVDCRCSNTNNEQQWEGSSITRSFVW